MTRTTARRWAVAVALCTWLGGCGRDAFVVVAVNGAIDHRAQDLLLSATVKSWHATESYSASTTELSFFLPEGTLGELVRVQVDARAAPCIFATGTSLGVVENRPRLDLVVELQPTQSCP